MKEKQKLYLFCFVCFILFISFNGQVLSMPASTPLNIPSVTPNSSPPVPKPVAMPLPNSATLPQKEMKMPEAGPETVDMTEDQIGLQGNWVKKREWLKESQKVNAEIQDLVLNIQKLRKPFSDKYSSIDNELDTFYKQEGFVQGKIQELFDSLLRYLEKKRKKEIKTLKQETDESGVTGEYEIKLDIIEDEIKSKKREFDQLKLDMSSLVDLDKSVNERLKKLDEQIKLVVIESEKAKKISNEIWYIIDDQKARVHYYQLKGNIFQRVIAIQGYIQGAFQEDFDNVLTTIKTQMDKIKGGVKNLETQGFIIRDRVKRLSQVKLQTLDEEKYGKVQLPESEENKTEKVKEFSWHEKLYNSFVDTVARVCNFFKRWFGI